MSDSTRISRLQPVLLVAAFMLQAISLPLLFREGLLPWAFLAHAAGAVAWGLGAARLFPRGQRPAWWQSGAWALTFPVVGPLASLCFASILRRPPVDNSGQRYVVWNEQPAGAWDNALPAGASGQSIVEILQSPRTQLRRNAVLALRELDPQLAIPLLRKGLQDSDEQVRIYAQNILSTMLERFEEGIKQLENRIASGQGDAATATRLAEQYFELVYLDVAGDDETAAHYLAKALALLEKAFGAAPDDPAIVFLGFKYALRARDAGAARLWLERLEQRKSDAQQVLPWRMELAFLEGDWKRLRALFEEFARARYINPRIEELSRFWLGTPASA